MGFIDNFNLLWDCIFLVKRNGIHPNKRSKCSMQCNPSHVTVYISDHPSSSMAQPQLAVLHESSHFRSLLPLTPISAHNQFSVSSNSPKSPTPTLKYIHYHSQNLPTCYQRYRIHYAQQHKLQKLKMALIRSLTNKTLLLNVLITERHLDRCTCCSHQIFLVGIGKGEGVWPTLLLKVLSTDNSFKYLASLFRYHSPLLTIHVYRPSNHCPNFLT